MGSRGRLRLAANYPERTRALVLVDGGYWDFADLPDYDPAHVSLASCIERAARRAAGERFPSWDAYFAAERAALKRWSPALEEAHRAAMREDGDEIVPIAGPETVGAIHYGNHLEPTASLHAALRASGVPVLLLTPTEGQGPAAAVGSSGSRRRFRSSSSGGFPATSADLVSHAPTQVAEIVGEWLRASAR